jgi:hypothetical protein
MAYTKYMSVQNPGFVVILIDQSGSMGGAFGGTGGGRKDYQCAMAVNRVLREIVINCTNGESIRTRCEVSVLGYGYHSDVQNAFSGVLAQKDYVNPEELANNCLRVETNKIQVLDNDGVLVEQEEEFPIWIEPVTGGGTPMAEAFAKAYSLTSVWANNHPESFPPIVINITDGMPNDMAATNTAAQKLANVTTNDGVALVFNIHISSDSASKIVLPCSNVQLPDSYAQFLFNISSELPETMLGQATQSGYQTKYGAKGFVYNADSKTMVDLLMMGSIAALH